jgi:hypothetical protein
MQAILLGKPGDRSFVCIVWVRKKYVSRIGNPTYQDGETSELPATHE